MSLGSCRRSLDQSLGPACTASTMESWSMDELLKSEDKGHRLGAGEIGLRAWQRTAQFVICNQ